MTTLELWQSSVGCEAIVVKLTTPDADGVHQTAWVKVAEPDLRAHAAAGGRAAWDERDLLALTDSVLPDGYEFVDGHVSAIPTTEEAL